MFGYDVWLWCWSLYPFRDQLVFQIGYLTDFLWGEIQITLEVQSAFSGILQLIQIEIAPFAIGIAGINIAKEFTIFGIILNGVPCLMPRGWKNLAITTLSASGTFSVESILENAAR